MSPATTSGEFIVKLYEERRLLASVTITRTTELGRREPTEPMPYVNIPGTNVDRLIIADLPETSVSRRHLRIEPIEDGQMALTNISARSSVILQNGTRVMPNERVIVDLPLACELGAKTAYLEWHPIDDDVESMQSLSDPARAPGHSSVRSKLRGSQPDSVLATFVAGGGNNAELLDWLQMVFDVFQSAAGSPDFLPKAVAAAAEMVGLETVAVLIKRQDEFVNEVVIRRDGQAVSPQWQASQTIVKNVAKQCRTFFQTPSQRTNVAASLQGVQSIVAAPILDSKGEILGILYGEGRSNLLQMVSKPVSEIEAKMFELIAYGVASGLARVDQEKKLVAERVRFEQFFTPELARELQSQGDEMLAGRELEISVMFCDIKGFSRISADCGAALAIEWVRDVLSELSDRVAEFQGVLVDYAGDSLEALWGAPIASNQHAIQACKAALAMRACLPEISNRWKEKLQHPTDITIGINSGLAQVGNIGSRRKFKYGALGTTVNLASRVQGATKYLGVTMLLTKSTAKQLSTEFGVRRLCSVRTVNIPDPVELYELVEQPTDEWLDLKKNYENALTLFEQQQIALAVAAVAALSSRFPSDIPTRELLHRSATLMSQSPGVAFDPVWELKNK
ncbi:MAG: adenylate/guanylate cyclase domain-containing protein [Planctomycetota bacterium]